MRRRMEAAPMPVYYEVQQALRHEIESGQLEPGMTVPPERRLAEIHGVSVGTVRKAVLNLVNEGYLYRVQGKGSFVAGTALRRESLRYYRFLSHFNDQEIDLKVKLLDLKTIKIFAEAKDYLQLESNTNLYEVKRVFVSDETPLVFTTSYMPIKLFKDLDKLPRSEFESKTLYHAVEENYGMPTIHNDELIGIRPADKEVGEVLNLDTGSPVLFMEMLSFTYKSKPYEYRRAYLAAGEKMVAREY